MFLGLDLGTGSLKALVMDSQGQIVAEAARSYEVDAPSLHWAETDPLSWWQACCEAVHQCLQTVKAHDIKALALSGQMHGLVFCDARGNPLRKAVLWADGRSQNVLKHYQALDVQMRLRLANPLAVGMAGVSLLWLKEHEQAIYRQGRWALQPKDWLRFKLSGEIHAEPSDASATLMFDVQADGWAFDIVEEVGLEPSHLPPLVPSISQVGTLTLQAATDLKLPPNIRIIAGAADAAASALGTGLIYEGHAQVNMGTGMQIFALRKHPKIDPSLKTHLYRTALDDYYAMAAMQNAGLVLERVRKLLNASWTEMYQTAFSLDSSEGLSFLPYISGERTPHLNPDAKATWHGLSLHHSRGHMMRAAFEGVAFALKDGLKALEEVAISPASLRFVGGGSLDPRWQQLVSDVLQKPLYASNVSDSSARGAAVLAALALGQFTLEDIHYLTPTHLVAEPKINEHLIKAYDDFKNLYPKLYR